MRPKKPARIVEREKRGKTYFVIVDDHKEMATGCDTRAEAEIKLAEYVLTRGIDMPKLGAPRLAELARVLAEYAREHGPTTAAPALVGIHVEHLTGFWGRLKMSDVNTKNSQAYIAHRTQMKWQGRNISATTANKELGTLQAAMNFFCREHGVFGGAPKVTKQAGAGKSRKRWLRRSEFARLLLAARRLGYPHLVRFLLIGRYTGTRLDAILRTRWVESPASGHFDLDAGVYYRRGDDERETKKERPPCTIPPKLLWFLKRWRAHDMDGTVAQTYVITSGGQPIDDIRANWNGLKPKTPWSHIVLAAGLTSDADGRRSTDVTPHVLRHTCATWALVYDRMTCREVGGIIGASEKMVDDVYGHHLLGTAEAGKARRA